MAMSDQLQVAVGLREAVRRWCLPVTNVPATSSGAPGASRCFKHAGASDVRFLDQLLLLRPLSAAEAPPLPVHLFQEGTGNTQDSRSQGITGDAFTPNSCSGASTFRSTLGDSFFLGRSHNDERDYSVEGGHLPFPMHQPCNDISSSGSRALPPAEAPQGPPKADGVPVARQAKPNASVPHVQQILPTDGPAVPEDNDCTEEKPLERPPALPTPEKRQERRLAAAASAGPASAATAAAGSTTAERPRRQQHQQQQPLQMLWQLRSCATWSLAAKGIKRRPEPLVGSQLLSRGGMQNGPAVATPAPSSGGSGSTRAEGPPQKRQAVARRRGETAPVTRSNSCSSCSSAKTSVPVARSRRDAGAGRGHTAGEGQSTSCRLRLSSNEASAKPKQQPLLQHQQRSRQLKAENSNNSATTHTATQGIRGDANELLGDIVCAPFPINQERTDALTAAGEFGGDDGAADAAGGAVAALRRSSNSSSIDDPVAAFAIEWLLGCEKRLRAAAGPLPGTAVSSNMETSKQRARASLSHRGSRSGSSGDLQRLQVTKKRLKQELKAYNSAFATHFGRQPLKQDKEPLRPVYMHYQLIKQLIDQLSPGAPEGSVTVAADSPSAAPARTPSGGATTAPPDDSSSVISRKTTESDKGARKGRSARMKEGRTASPSPTGARRQVHGGGGPRSPVQAKGRERRCSQLTAYERQQQMQQRREEMTAQLHQLQRERRILGDKLAAYHHRFKQEHGRPLRLKTDIAPVQHEYNLFVETTKRIDAIAYALQKQAI